MVCHRIEMALFTGCYRWRWIIHTYLVAGEGHCYYWIKSMALSVESHVNGYLDSTG